MGTTSTSYTYSYDTYYKLQRTTLKSNHFRKDLNDKKRVPIVKKSLLSIKQF